MKPADAFDQLCDEIRACVLPADERTTSLLARAIEELIDAKIAQLPPKNWSTPIGDK